MKKMIPFSSKLKIIDASELLTSSNEKDYVGCGGHGSVRICQHNELGEVVTKCFVISGLKEEIHHCINSVKREAEVLVRIEHENIVKIHGFSQWNDNHIAIILEYVKCGNLDGLLKSVHEVPWCSRLSIAQQTMSALCYLHNYPGGRKFYHGDIKPDNILLDVDLNVKLADFGSVNIIKATNMMSTTLDVVPTQQHTLHYAAPEVLKRKEAGTFSDMFSVGMVFYEMVTRRRVYEGATCRPEILIAVILSGERPELDKVEAVEASLTTDGDKKIASVLIDLMKSCWKEDPAERPTALNAKKMLDISIDENLVKEENKTIATLLLKQKQRAPSSQTQLSNFVRNFVSATGGSIFSSSPLVAQSSTAIDDAASTSSFLAPEAVISALQDEPSTPTAFQQATDGSIFPSSSTDDVTSSSSPLLVAQSSTAIDDAATTSSSQKAVTFVLQDEPSTSMSLHSFQQATGSSIFPSSSTDDVTSSSSLPLVAQSSTAIDDAASTSTALHSFLEDGDESAHDLVQQYVTLVREKKYEEANRVAVDLHQLLQGQVERTAEEFRQLGIKLRGEKKYLESVLFLQISSIISANYKNPKKAVEENRFCAEELMWTNIKMLESDVTMKPIVRDHVLPLMRDLQMKIEQKQNIGEKFRVLNLAWCLHSIGYSEYLIDDLESCERSLKKAISSLEKTFGREASKHHVYALCLNNLGLVCEQTSRFTDAVKYYKRALEAWKKAEDSSEEVKKKSIQITEKSLRECKSEAETKKCKIM